MVSTRQAGKTRKSADEGSPPVDSDEEYEERVPEHNKTRGTKRARTAKTTVKGKQQGKRRKKAKLSMLPEMSIDILYEIFSLVHPRDLMRVSWTAKVFNEFLTSKSSRHVWQASFSTIPKSEQPPACPSGMTEMAYANLLYGQCCMNCASTSPLIPAWRALVRLCGSCVDEIAMSPSSAWLDDPAYETIRDICEVLPWFLVRSSTQGVIKRVLCSDSKRFSEELAAAGKRSKRGVIKRYRSLVRERDEFADVMSGLERAAEQLKANARVEVQKRRIERIWEKLSEEGWGEEIAARKSMYEPELMEIKGVVMVRPLGEKAWAELRGPLNEFMRDKSEGIKAQLDAGRCESRIRRVGVIVDSFLLSLPHPHDFSPSRDDICWIPEVRKIIVDGTDEEFRECETDLRSRIPELSVAWLEERRKFFLKLLPQDSPTLEHLSLATTLFDCTKCPKVGLHIEDALSHSCYSYNYGGEHRASFRNAASASAFYMRTGTPWDSGLAKYEYSAKLSALVREVVVQCGEDPDTITTQEMNRRHHRFARFGCRDGTIAVLNWLEAFEYKRCRVLGDPPCRLLRPDELPEYVPYPEDKKPEWGCLHCWGAEKPDGPKRRHQYFSVIRDHLARSHRIMNPTEGDYYRDDPKVAVGIIYRPGNGV